MGSEQILAHEDVGELVFAQLSLAELSALADAQPVLLPMIKALETRWLRGCLELCGGSWHNLGDRGRAGDWHELWHELSARRTKYLDSMIGGLPEALPWGGEEWARLHDLPREAEMRDALARCALFHPSVIDGLGDEQCDSYPIGAAFYKRDAQTAEGPLGPAAAYKKSIKALRAEFYPNCCGDVLDKAVMEPISVSALLANLPSPIKLPDRPDEGSVLPGLPEGRLQRAIFDAAARCAPFVALCVGEAPALTPAQALEVLSGTRTRIIKERLGWIDSSCINYCYNALEVGAKGRYCTGQDVGIDARGMVVSDGESAGEGKSAGDDGDSIIALGIDQVERELKAQLTATAAQHGIAHAGLAMAAAGGTPLGLSWDAGLAVEGAPCAGKVLKAAVEALAVHKEELAELIGAQLRAVHGDGALDAATVYPVMLTDSDLLRSYWSGAAGGDNDHEGVQAFAFVSETWALVVASKCSSC